MATKILARVSVQAMGACTIAVPVALGRGFQVSSFAGSIHRYYRSWAGWRRNGLAVNASLCSGRPRTQGNKVALNRPRRR